MGVKKSSERPFNFLNSISCWHTGCECLSKVYCNNVSFFFKITYQLIYDILYRQSFKNELQFCIELKIFRQLFHLKIAGGSHSSTKIRIRGIKFTSNDYLFKNFFFVEKNTWLENLKIFVSFWLGLNMPYAQECVFFEC